MTLRIIGVDDLKRAVSYEDLIEPVSLAFQQSSAGLGENGLLVMFPQPQRDRGDVYVKTGTLLGQSVYIVKVSPWFAENIEKGQPQGGFIAVFDSATGHTLALLDEQHYLSDIRTAAAGALAARVLAPKYVKTAAILGAGVQAFWQAQALFRERPFQALQIWARDAVKADHLRKRLVPLLPGVEIWVAELEEAVRSADVIISATLARMPILRGEWLRPGQHITAVGADDPTKCEMDSLALNRSRVFVDSLETTAANGDVYHALAAGEYRLDQIDGEIGDVLAGRAVGRQSDQDITIAKFVGIGAQDLAAAKTSLGKLNVISP